MRLVFISSVTAMIPLRTISVTTGSPLLLVLFRAMVSLLRVHGAAANSARSLSPLEGFAQLISDDSIVTNDSGGFGDGGTGGWSAGLGGRVGVGASGPDAG